jgi:hypothetical protein
VTTFGCIATPVAFGESLAPRHIPEDLTRQLAEGRLEL